MYLSVNPIPLSRCRVWQLPENFTAPAVALPATGGATLICPTAEAPENTIRREDGLRAIVACDTVDHTLTGILAGVCTTLAAGGVAICAAVAEAPVFVVIEDADTKQAVAVLRRSGYRVEE